MEDILVVRSGRRLEVRESGDPGGHPAFFFHGLIGSHHQASDIDEQAKERGFEGHRPEPSRRGPVGVHEAKDPA